jgi:hypothetical protein
VFVDRPGEFVVQLPSDDGQANGSKRKNARNGNEERLGLSPNFQVNFILQAQGDHSFFDLIHLDSCIDQEADVIDADADDLNSVLEAEGIINEYYLVQETEDVEREKRGNGS